MDLRCNCCDFLNITPLQRDLFKFGRIRREKTCEFDERMRILTSSQSCRLCNKIYTFLKKRYLSEFDQRDAANPIIRIISQFSVLTHEKGHCSAVHVSWKTGMLGKGMFLAIWADEGTRKAMGCPAKIDELIPDTPASADFVTRPPILHDTTEEISSLVRAWLDNCEVHHESCQFSPVSDQREKEAVKLPSRLLFIDGDNDSIIIRLVETAGETGRYCALSHCWGPPDKRPLRTMRSTYPAHLAGIPLHQLPATFKEAALLVHGLGMNYLWIDSLCIVQDDRYDWLKESAKMGSVYKNAILVIAAAGSMNCTEGLFIVERPGEPLFRFPYFAEDGVLHGCYNVAVLPADSRISELLLDGPLRRRAWASQEWYLSRRKVFFTPEGVKWHCRQFGCAERGDGCDLFLHETISWLAFLDQYSGRELTYPSDRLFAIEGIVNEMKKSRDDHFKFGVWENNLAEQLLWRFVNFPTKPGKLPDIHSWSWAATGGYKCWIMRHKNYRDTAVAIALTDTGCVKASGLLRKASVAAHPFPDCCIETLNRSLQNQTQYGANLEIGMLPGDHGKREAKEMESFLLLDVEETDMILGIAIFDELARFSEIFCLFLVSSGREEDDPCHPDFPGYLSGSNNSSEIVWDESEESVGDEGTISDVQGGVYIAGESPL